MTKIQKIKNNFKDTNLFETALTHRSWVNENRGIRTSNERLEFLGDAVIELIVTTHLYNRLPDSEEGVLTQIRANIVNTTNLAKATKQIKLDEQIHFSKGEEKSGRTSMGILADTFEALVGAIYIDRGLKAAEEFIQEELLFDFDEKISGPLKDAKSKLQEYLQAKKSHYSYKVINIAGPDHDREFTVQVIIDGKIVGEGKGHSKSEAEQKAADVALTSGIH